MSPFDVKPKDAPPDESWHGVYPGDNTSPPEQWEDQSPQDNDTQGQEGGPGAAYVKISDGIRTASAVPADTLLFRSSDSSIGITVKNNDPTYGDNVDLIIPPGAIAGDKIPDNAITFAKLQDIPADTLIGRDDTAPGDPGVITIGGGIEFTGAGGLQRSALTGDVTAPAGGGVTTIPDETVKPKQLTFLQSPGGNAVINPNFANRTQTAASMESWVNPPTGWTAVARGGSAPLNAAPTPFCLQIAPTAVNQSLIAHSGYIACRPSEKIFVGLYAAADAAVTNGVLRIRVWQVLNTGGGVALTVDFVPTGTWGRFETTFTLNAAAAGYRYELWRIGGADTGNIFVTQCWCERAMSMQNSFAPTFDVSGAKLDIAAHAIDGKKAGDAATWGNLVPNPAFMAPAIASAPAASVLCWDAFPSLWSVVQRAGSTPPISTCPSPWMLQISAPGSSAGGVNDQFQECKPGELLVVSCYAASDGGGVLQSLALGYQYLSDAGVVTANPSGYLIPAGSLSTTWQKFESVLTVPANCCGVRIRLTRANDTGTAKIFVTLLEVTRFVTQSHIGGGLDASAASIQRAALTGDVTAALGVNATVIAENIVRGAKLSIPDTTNLFLDPLFLDGASGAPRYWTSSGGIVFNNADAAAIASTGLNAPVVVKSGTGNGTTSQVNDAVNQDVAGVGDYIAVVPGENYTLSLQSMELAGFTGLLRIDYNWWQGNKTTAVGAQVQTNIVDRRTVAAPANANYNTVLNITAPANARWFNCRIIVIWSTTLANAQACYFTWIRLVRVPAGQGVMGASGASHAAGLAPDPGATAGSAKFLCENATWAVPSGTGTGVTNAYGTITDGTTPAIASGADTFKVRSQDGSIAVSTQNNDATHGDNANFQLSAALQTSIANNTSGLAAANSNIAANTSDIATHTSQIATHTSQIAANTTALTGADHTIKGRADGAGSGIVTDLSALPSIDAGPGLITPNGFPGTSPMAVVAKPALLLHGTRLTTESFNIPNDGSASGVSTLNAMFAAWLASSQKTLSVMIPAGAGLVIDSALADILASTTDDHHLELYGQGMGLSYIQMRTTGQAVHYNRTAGQGVMRLRIHDLTFQTNIENAGCCLNFEHQIVTVPTDHPQLVIERVDFRVDTPAGQCAYWGDFPIKINRMHRAVIRDVWMESPRLLGTKLSVAISAPIGTITVPVGPPNPTLWMRPNVTYVTITLDPVTGQPGTHKAKVTAVNTGTGLVTFTPNTPAGRTAAINNAVNFDADNTTHDADSSYLGQGFIQVRNCYGPVIDTPYSSSGRYGALHGHDFTDAPEGGAWIDPHWAHNKIGYRSATHDDQPGLTIAGAKAPYATSRDNAVNIGGVVVTGTATAGGSNFITLGEDPPALVTTGTLTQTGGTGPYNNLVIDSQANLTSDWVNIFVSILRTDNVTWDHCYNTAIVFNSPSSGKATLTLAGSLPPAGMTGKTVKVFVIGRNDQVHLPAGAGWGQLGLATGYNSVNKNLSVGSWTDGVAPAAGTRYAIESVNVIGGRRNVVIGNIISTLGSDYDRADGRHGILKPTDLELTNAAGVVINGGTIHFGGTYTDLNRRAIAIGPDHGTVPADLVINGMNFDGNGEYIIFNPDDDRRITWGAPAISGEWLHPLSNGKILKAGGYPCRTLIHSGGRPPATVSDGTDVAAVGNIPPSTSRMYFCEIPPITELTRVAGACLVTGPTVFGNFFLMLWQVNDAGRGVIIATGPTAGAPVSAASSMVDFFFWNNTTGQAAVQALVPGRYFIGGIFNNSGGACHFMAHPFGRFGANYRASCLFGTGADIISVPDSCTPGTGPIMCLFS